MARETTYEYDGNIASMYLAEGAWTDSSDYVKGGYFATPLKEGDYVELDTTGTFRVKACATAANAIGYLVGSPVGPNVANNRVAGVYLFCDKVGEAKLATNSYANDAGSTLAPFSVASAVLYWASSSAGGTAVKALKAHTSGSAETIPAMFGVWDVTA